MAPVYLIPSLIDTFTRKYNDDEPGTVGDLVVQHLVGSLFECDEGSFVYVGVMNDRAMVRPINSEVVMEMRFDTNISWVF